ncbi:MAG: tetratricopeptide repeat protein [Nitrospiria bacterium]
MIRTTVFILLFFLGFILVNGCAPIRESPTQPPLTFPPPAPPPSGLNSGIQNEEAPRRMASLHLTEKGKGELEQGELKRAMDRFEKAISLDSRNSAAYYYFAEARFRQKEFQQSLTLLNRAELLMANDADWLIKVYLLQGKNYEAMANKKEADKKFQKVLSLNPSEPEALKHLK